MWSVPTSTYWQIGSIAERDERPWHIRKVKGAVGPPDKPAMWLCRRVDKGKASDGHGRLVTIENDHRDEF